MKTLVLTFMTLMAFFSSSQAYCKRTRICTLENVKQVASGYFNTEIMFKCDPDYKPDLYHRVTFWFTVENSHYKKEIRRGCFVVEARRNYFHLECSKKIKKLENYIGHKLIVRRFALDQC